MDISLVLPPEPDERWTLAQQVGVEHAVFHSLEIGDGSIPYEYDELLRIVNRYRDHGMEPAVFEGSVPVTDTTRLALDGRDEETERSARSSETWANSASTSSATTGCPASAGPGPP